MGWNRTRGESEAENRIRLDVFSRFFLLLLLTRRRCVPSSGDDGKHDVKVARRSANFLKVQRRTRVCVRVCLMSAEQVKRAECVPSCLSCLSGQARKESVHSDGEPGSRCLTLIILTFRSHQISAFFSVKTTFGVKGRPTR